MAGLAAELQRKHGRTLTAAVNIGTKHLPFDGTLIDTDHTHGSRGAVPSV